MTEHTLPFPASLPAAGQVVLIRVFVNGPGGGNPVPLVADARGMDAAQMQEVARAHGHESAFVLPADVPGADWRLRFFVPHHEMEMCGHATVGTLWALRRWGLWTTPTARVQTMSGLVDVEWDAAGQRVWISQPAVREEVLDASAAALVARTLRLHDATPRPTTNAATSRVKTLVPLPEVAALQALAPDFAAMESTCDAIASTGLYPYALQAGGPVAEPTVFARQFPRKSGYPEDAATGIAAAALWGHLAAAGTIPVGSPAQPVVCTVRQGDAMGSPSAIAVRPRFDAQGNVAGCWLSGEVVEGAA
ncbi:phenazine biosynthesis protein PhzF family [Acidovorax sp. CF316]|uniref:PhzF family phenazine biosynthesis protein n=1 Tax=Acidovorax sp. CF316 TaxID=1144317 RepID=UPI00026BCABD|nr:PhzF family phenazine biosynthesis isomerase [Acidovorax sp. CF316]EJE53761.1 phenazine biosynthesis protein PhzF family [Acidovorax sp. CF316]